MHIKQGELVSDISFLLFPGLVKKPVVVGWENSLINSNYSTPPKKWEEIVRKTPTQMKMVFFFRKLLLGNVRTLHNYLLRFKN